MDEVLSRRPEEDRDAEHIEQTIGYIGEHYSKLLDPETRDQAIQDMSYEEFRRYLLSVNAYLRGKSPENHTFDGKDMVLAGGLNEYETPADEDKDELLRDIFETAQTLPPYDRGLALGLGINMVHAFGDGNGGLSRLTFTVFGDRDKTQTTPDELRQVLSHDGRNKLDITPIFIDQFIRDRMLENETFINAGSPKLKYNEQIVEEGLQAAPADLRTKFVRMLRTSYDNLARLAIFEHVHENGSATVFDMSLNKNEDTAVINLYPEIIESATQEEIEDILNRFRKLKADLVKMTIDSIAHPESYPLTNVDDRAYYGNVRGYLIGWGDKIPAPHDR